MYICQALHLSRLPESPEGLRKSCDAYQNHWLPDEVFAEGPRIPCIIYIYTCIYIYIYIYIYEGLRKSCDALYLDAVLSY